MISPLASIDPKAKLGREVTVLPFSYIAADVEVGDGCRIGPGAVLLDGARLGKNCTVDTGAVIAGLPQDLKFRGEYSTVVIGDNTRIREGVTINRGTAAKGVTSVGSNTLIMGYVHIAHDVTVGSNCVIVNSALLAGEVEVGDWAIISGHSAVHQFVHIGEHAMVSGGSLLSKDVPPYITVGHYPPSFMGVNFIGLRRRGFTSERVTEIQDACRILFQSGYGYSKACDIIMETIPQSRERDLLVNSVRSSKRGIIKPYNPAKEEEESL